VRSKSGAGLTPAGEQFLRYAPMFVQLWERARHQVAVPRGRRAVLAVGGELSLWHPWLLDWLHWMRREAGDIALRVQVDAADSLARQVAEGVLDIAVMYAPQQRPGARIELLLEEQLVLVTTHAAAHEAASDDYVFVDWGPDFTLHHGLNFPEAIDAGLSIGLGPLALSYILEAGGSGYFRRRAVAAHLAEGRLALVPGAPGFSYPVYAVCSARGDDDLIARALVGLRAVAQDSER
jgi:DNA-binding transcriptional LysR family regulator